MKEVLQTQDLKNITFDITILKKAVGKDASAKSESKHKN